MKRTKFLSLLVLTTLIFQIFPASILPASALSSATKSFTWCDSGFTPQERNGKQQCVEEKQPSEKKYEINSTVDSLEHFDNNAWFLATIKSDKTEQRKSRNASNPLDAFLHSATDRQNRRMPGAIRQIKITDASLGSNNTADKCKYGSTPLNHCTVHAENLYVGAEYTLNVTPETEGDYLALISADDHVRLNVISNGATREILNKSSAYYYMYLQPVRLTAGTHTFEFLYNNKAGVGGMVADLIGPFKGTDELLGKDLDAIMNIISGYGFESDAKHTPKVWTKNNNGPHLLWSLADETKEPRFTVRDYNATRKLKKTDYFTCNAPYVAHEKPDRSVVCERSHNLKKGEFSLYTKNDKKEQTDKARIQRNSQGTDVFSYKYALVDNRAQCNAGVTSFQSASANFESSNADDGILFDNESADGKYVCVAVSLEGESTPIGYIASKDVLKIDKTPPVITATDTTVDQNTPLSHVITVTDDSEVETTVEFPANNPGFTYDDTTKTIGGTPNKPGVYKLKIIATDKTQTQNKSEKEITITVADKTPPVITATDTTVDQNTPLSHVITVTDDSEVETTVEFPANNPGFTYDDTTKTIGGTPNKPGVYKLKIIATDKTQTQNKSEKEITITVADKTPPVITATDTTVDQNTPLSHVITVTDDSEVETTVEFPANNPGFTYDDTTKTIGGTPNKPGVYKLKIIATDKTQTQNKSEKEITITVADKTPPVITATDTTVDQNTPLSHVITVTDDSEVETTVEFPANNPGFTYDDTTKTIGGTPNKPGVYKLKIIATDKTQTQNKSEKEITITVADKTPPVITATDTTVDQNTPLSHVITVTDDSEVETTVEFPANNPGFTYDDTTKTIGGTPNKPGVYKLKIIATDKTQTQNKSEKEITITVADKTPPVITATDTTVDQNTPLSHVITVTDDSEVETTVEFPANNPGFTYDDTTKTIGGTPNKPGVYKLKIIATDKTQTQNKSEKEITITVADKTPPVITATDTTVDQNTPLSHVITVTDDSEVETTVEFPANNPGFTYDDTTKTIGGTPNKPGVYKLKIIATDKTQTQNKSEKEITITVADKTPPVITATDTTVDQNTPLSHVITVTDDSEVETTVEFPANNPGFTYDDTTKTIGGTPNKPGVYKLKIIATDKTQTQNKSEKEITITVADKTPPVITATDTTVDQNTPLSHVITVTDDSEVETTVEFPANNPGFTYDDTTKTIGGTPNKPGVYKLKIIATDKTQTQNKSEKEITITVADKTPPVITATDTTVDQNTPLSHVITVTDDSEVETTVEFPANNPGFTYDDTTKTIGGTPNKPGVYKLKIIATDKTQTQNKSEKEITITVADKTPPVITATDTTVDQNTPLSHVITVTDDSEVETTVEFPANNPGFTYDDTTKTIGGTPNKPGVYKLKIIATDKTQTQNKSEKEITITVADKTPPVITATDTTVDQNTPLSHVITVTDDSEVETTVEFPANNPGFTYDDTTKTIGGTPNKPGVYKLKIIATDKTQTQNKSEKEITITVADKTPPVITATDTTVDQNTPLSHVITVTDDSEVETTVEFPANNPGFTYDDTTKTIGGTPNKPGVYKLKIIATDKTQTQNKSEKEITITVADKTPPVITATDTTVDQNTPLSHVITVTDDSEVETTVEFPANNPGFTYDDTTKTIGGTPNKPGVYKLKIIATDKTQTQNKSEKEITITVADKTPPVITATDTTVDQNTPLSHVITVTDDSEVETTVEFPANNPGFTYDDTTKTIGGTPNKPGVYKLKIIATDKTQTQNKSEKEITITVADKTPPVITATDTTVDQNTPLSHVITVTDDSEVETTVEFPANNPGFTYDDTTKTIGGTPNKPGVYKLKIIATDKTQTQNKSEKEITITVADKTPPVITATDTTVDQNTPLSHVITVTDDSEVETTVEFPANNPGFTYDDTTKTIGGTPNKPGVYKLKIIATDKTQTQNKSEKEITITVADKTPPVITATDTTVDQNTPLSHVITVTDDSEVETTVEFPANNPGFTYDDTTKTIGGTPNKPGVYKLKIIATDKTQTQNKSEKEITITVADKTPPVITATDTTVDQNTPLSHVITVTDDSEVETTVEFPANNPGFTYDDTTKTIGGTPNKPGVYKLKIIATDKTQTQNKSEKEITITVADKTPPVITATDTTVDQNTPLSHVITVTDDSEVETTVEFPANNPGFTYDDTTKTIGGTPNKPGVYKLKIIATDKTQTQNKSEKEITITVADKTPPVITATDTTVDQNTPLSHVITVTDDSEVETTVEFPANNPGFTYDDTTKTIGGTPNKPGVYKLKIIATDKTQTQNKSEKEITITVADKTPPVITATDTTVDQNTPLSHVITVTDDSEVETTVEFPANNPGFTYDDTTKTIGGTPNKPGVYKLKIIATDKTQTQNKSEKEITITVADKTPPVITGYSAKTLIIGSDEVTSYNPLDGITILDNMSGTYDPTALCKIDPVYNRAVAATYTVTCNATDANGNTATEFTRTITIHPTDKKPLQDAIAAAKAVLNDPKTVDNVKKTALQKLVDDAEVALTDENLTPDAQQKHIEALENPEKQVERKKPSSGGGSGGGGGSYVAPTPTNLITPMNPTIPNNPNNNSNNNTPNQNNNNSNNTNNQKPTITPEGTLSTQHGVTPSNQTTPSWQKVYNLSNRITDYICPAIVQAYLYNELVVQDISNSPFQDDIAALMMFRGMEKDEMNLGQTYQEYKKYGVVNNVAQFQPNRNVTRAEFVKMLVRSLSCRYTYLGTDTGFSDVDQSQWYAEYIKFAVENKWINGYKDGTFRPNAPITRDEAAKILTRAIQLSTQNSNYTTSFSDVPASSEFIPYIETLKSHGIMKGRNSHAFAPKEFIPRTETSRMIYRTFFGGNV